VTIRLFPDVLSFIIRKRIWRIELFEIHHIKKIPNDRATRSGNWIKAVTSLWRHYSIQL